MRWSDAIVAAGIAAGWGARVVARTLAHPPASAARMSVAANRPVISSGESNGAASGLLCCADRDRRLPDRVRAAPAHRTRSLGALARHRVSRIATRPLPPPSATTVTHGELPGLTPWRGDFLARRRRFRRGVQLARPRRGCTERDDQLPRRRGAGLRAAGRGARGQAGP